jgi:putative DNA primase/helicase
MLNESTDTYYTLPELREYIIENCGSDLCESVKRMIHCAADGSDEGLEVYREWYRLKADPYPGDEATAREWREASESNAKPVSLSDVENQQPPLRHVSKIPTSHNPCTDQANAQRLHARYGHKIFSVRRALYAYTGRCWERNEAIPATCAATLSDIVHGEAQTARAKFEAYAAENPDGKKLEATKRRDKSKLQDTLLSTAEGAEMVAALTKAEALERWEKECESRPRQLHAVGMLRDICQLDPSKLDCHPELLNCQNGTLDLRTGELKPHDPKDFLTKITPVKYNADALALRFEKFVGEIMDGDQERVQFLQRWYGYACTAETREQKFVIHAGPGGGGKGTFLNAVADVMGQYACTAARGLITGRGGDDRHPTEIIDLLGRRLVTAHESDAGAELREGFVKQATGEDSLKGRAMRQDLVEFRPTHKLQLLTNYEPVIQGSDFGIWRRVLLVKYDVKFGSAEQIATGKAHELADPTLADALRNEREGILAWLVRGAIEWYKTGLRPPASVLAATDEYQSEQDRADQFVQDCCTLDKTSWVSYGDLHREYQTWCLQRGYRPLGLGKLLTELKRLVPFFEKDGDGRKQVVGGKRKTVRGCYGLRLNSGFNPPPVVEPPKAPVKPDNTDLL